MKRSEMSQSEKRRELLPFFVAIAFVCLLGGILQMAGCAVTGESTPDPAAARAEAERAGMSLEATRVAVDLERERADIAIERERLDLERQQARARSVDQSVSTFLAALPWVILAVGLGAFVVVAYLMLPVVVARYGLVRRGPQEGEPVWLMGRDRFALPLRAGNVYADLERGAERSPLLASSAEMQERATLRQQTVNLTLANQVGAVVKALTGAGDVNLMLLPEPTKREPAPALAAPSPVRVLPEPTRAVAGWIEDTERALLPEVISDGTSD